MKIKSFSFANAKLIRGGEFYLQKLIERIDASQEQIIINVYSFELDESGKMIFNHLIMAAKRGVKIFILLDSIGSWTITEVFVEKMKSHGIHVTFFNPLFYSMPLEVGRRLHQKVFIFDQVRAFVGGINISNEYLRPQSEVVWLDYVLYLRGEIAFELAKIASRYHHRIQIPECKTAIFSANKNIGQANILIQDFWKGKFEILNAYNSKIADSMDSILIMNAYFFPETWFLNVLKRKASAGVKVKIILGKTSDVSIAKWATNALYFGLLKSGVEIYEWKPSVLHAKMAIIDSKWCTIGSYNIDYLSKFGNIEMNIASEDPFLLKQIQNEFESLLNSNLERVHFTTWEQNNRWYLKLRDQMAYIVFRFLRVIFIANHYDKGKHERNLP